MPKLSLTQVNFSSLLQASILIMLVEISVAMKVLQALTGIQHFVRLILSSEGSVGFCCYLQLCSCFFKKLVNPFAFSQSQKEM